MDALYNFICRGLIAFRIDAGNLCCYSIDHGRGLQSCDAPSFNQRFRFNDLLLCSMRKLTSQDTSLPQRSLILFFERSTCFWFLLLMFCVNQTLIDQRLRSQSRTFLLSKWNQQKPKSHSAFVWNVQSLYLSSPDLMEFVLCFSFFLPNGIRGFYVFFLSLGRT